MGLKGSGDMGQGWVRAPGLPIFMAQFTFLGKCGGRVAGVALGLPMFRCARCCPHYGDEVWGHQWRAWYAWSVISCLFAGW